jgi:hypothetical protein
MSAVPKQVRQQMEKIDALLRTLEVADARTADAAREVVVCLLEMHRAGLARMVALMQMSASGDALVAACAKDDAIDGLLLLHDLHPLDKETRVRQALDNLRPHLERERARLDFLGLKEQTVWLRIHGEYGDRLARALPLIVEAAISAAAPDVTAIQILGPEEPGPMGVLVSLPLVAAEPGS